MGQRGQQTRPFYTVLNINKEVRIMKKTSIVLIGIIAIFLVIGGILASSYNNMVSKKETIENTLSDLDVMLQRRADLIPNLVSTVKGYMNHESEIINQVTEARKNLVNANTVSEKLDANEELTHSLQALMVVVENYPELKSSSNFIQLSDELAGTENRISVARRDYNMAVNQYNTTIKKFPNMIFASLFGFEKENYYEAEASSTKVPSVSFE